MKIILVFGSVVTAKRNGALFSYPLPWVDCSCLVTDLARNAKTAKNPPTDKTTVDKMRCDSSLQRSVSLHVVDLKLSLRTRLARHSHTRRMSS